MRRLLLFASAIVFVDTMFFAAVVPLLPRLSDDFELSKTAAGILSGAYAAGTLVASVPAGLLASRVGVRPTLFTGLGLMSASGIVFATADDIVLLDVARFVQGVGGACSWAGALGWLIGAAPRERRGELIGSAMAAAIGGVLFGPVLGGAAVGLGRGPVFGAVALLGLAMIALTSRLPAPVASPETSARESLAAVVTAPAVRVGLALILIPGLLFGAVDVLVPLRLDELGAGAGAIAVVFVLAALTEAAVNPVAGRLSDRYGRITPSKVGLATSTVAALVLILPETALLLGSHDCCSGSCDRDPVVARDRPDERRRRERRRRPGPRLRLRQPGLGDGPHRRRGRRPGSCRSHKRRHHLRGARGHLRGCFRCPQPPRPAARAGDLMAVSASRVPSGPSRCRRGTHPGPACRRGTPSDGRREPRSCLPCRWHSACP